MTFDRAPCRATTEKGVGQEASSRLPLGRSTPRHRLAIVSRHRLYRDALVSIVASVPLLHLVGTPMPEEVGRSALVCDIVVLDARLGEEGAALVDRLRQQQPRLPIVVLGGGAGADAPDWAERRVATFLNPDGSAADIIVAVLQAARAGSEPPRSLPDLALPGVAAFSATEPAGSNLSVLTPREEVVLRMAAEGLANKEIARCLKISESTVKNHMHNVLDKMGARRRGEAVARFQRERGLSAPLARPGVPQAMFA